ncbi:MAG: nickel ABC transporter substrate-binding protein [Spirochaetaceae bacterium]|jgi:nickel transport system substrate-binding protein|nr:nickel ABC transporter substrate-binding protein [Spirochaetaceae bacterium]
MRKERMVALVLVIIAGILVSGCGKGGNSKAAENIQVKKDLTYAAPTEMGDINIHLYAGDMAVQDMVFEPLVDNTVEGIKPAMAESWDISSDGREYIFHLRKGLKFHDGEPFNANAVKLNFDAILNNIERHSWMSLTQKIQNYEALDEHTFKMVLSEAYYPALTELGLTRPFRFISPRNFIDGETKNGVNGYAGTGAWILKEHIPAEYAVFEANPDYWNGKPEIEKLTRKVLPIGLTTLLALEKGEVDILFTNLGADMFDADALNQIAGMKKYQVVRSSAIVTKMLLANTSNISSPASDENVRLALWYAIDRNVIAEKIMNSMDKPADTLFAKSVPYANIPLEKRSYDLEKAKQILEDSGWKTDTGYRSKDGRPLEITLNYTLSKAGEKAICEYIQSQCQKIGLKVNVQGVDRVVAVRTTPGFDIVLDYTWGAPYDPQSTLSAFHGSNSYKIPTSGMKNIDVILKNIDSALVEFDETKRQEFYTYVLTEIHNQASFIPVSYGSLMIVAPVYLENIGFNQSQYEIPFDRFTYQK